MGSILLTCYDGLTGIYSPLLRLPNLPLNPRYPVLVEIKGGMVSLNAETIYITSNLHPNDWYPDLDVETKAALIRRLNITHFN